MDGMLKIKTYVFSKSIQFVRCALINKLFANFLIREFSILFEVGVELEGVLITVARTFDFLLFIERSCFLLVETLSLVVVLDGSVVPILYT